MAINVKASLWFGVNTGLELILQFKCWTWCRACVMYVEWLSWEYLYSALNFLFSKHDIEEPEGRYTNIYGKEN